MLRRGPSVGALAGRLRLTAVVLAAALLSGCASLPRNGISDPQLAAVATVPGLDGVRFWADEITDDPIAEIKRRTPNMPRVGRDAKRVAGRPMVETLALSGGGADGAFGAGVLTGWTARGDRPEFEVVTGVSAGAIIAPFAFIGPTEDETLRRIWTEYHANDIAVAQILPGLFGGDALADTTPLAKLVAQYIDQPMLDKIAAQYARGRILMVLTTNLDAQRPVVWNMGEIARTRTPAALELFRKVVLASAAIPGAFPPVNIPVVANGKSYEEMHVDGGTMREIFVLPVQAPFRAFDPLYAKPPIRKLYLVKNGKLSPEQEVVTQSTLPIAGRAISTLIKSQNWSELYRIYRLAKDDGADFNLIAVPPTFNHETKKIYDAQYQRALFEEGVKAGRAGAWAKVPPGQSLNDRTNKPRSGGAVPAAKPQPEPTAPEAAPDTENPAAPPPPPAYREPPPSAWEPTVKPAKGRPVASAG